MSWQTVSSPPALRAEAVLTNALVYSNPLEVVNQNQVCALIDFTLGSLTNMLLRTQVSYDKTNWYDVEIDDTQNEATVGTDVQIPARALVRVFDGNCALAIQVPVKAAWLRFGVIGTGTVTGSSCTITPMVGVA